MRAHAERAGFAKARVLFGIIAMLFAAGCGDGSGAPAPATFMVGAAKRQISPSVMTVPPDGNVWLGGYGFGRVRKSTGLLAPIYVRAMVIAAGEQVVAFAENETQGAFPVYKRGPFGLTDIAAAVEAATGGQIPRTHVIVSSDHSHAGPDTTGVWGGLPDSYMAFIRDQTVGAITDALAARRPAQLLSGTADATALLHSQFDTPPNDQVDGELRVLVAADPADATRHQSVLINFAAHATVMGSDNTLVSADWPGVVATNIEAALGIDTAVVMVADVGRTQPNRSEVPGETDPEKLAAYAGDVTARVLAAADTLSPAGGTQIDATQLFLRETYANDFFPLVLLGSVIARSNKPPWLDGGVVGTVVSAVRVGDLFFAAVPGEAYPAIQFALQERVPAARHFIFGLANDQLGYLIAPEEGYSQVADAAPDNDNALFNVSPVLGDHVMCTLFKAARRIGFTLPDDPAKCAPYATEDNTLPL
jgi:hypothetical protein